MQSNTYAALKTPTNDEELYEAVRLLTGVKIPRVKVCPNHVAPFTAFADSFFARHSTSVWYASRGFGGKTYMLALLGYVEALLLAARVNILGGSGKQSENVIQYHDSWWSLPQAPVAIIRGRRQITSTKFLTDAYIYTLKASQRSIRGPHPERLLLDELDEIDIGLFNAATGQTQSHYRVGHTIKAQLTASSTWQYPNGTMKYVMDLANEKGWPVWEWCYRETLEPHGWLTREELESKKHDTPSLMWETEYELQEPNAGVLALDTLSVDGMFGVTGDGQYEKYEGKVDEYLEFELPQAGGRYVTGADWARKVDKTAIATLRIDCTPARLVAFEQMNRRTWDYMIGRLETRLLRYGGVGNHDATGLGDIVAERLQGNAELRKSKVKVLDTILVGKHRSDMISSYVSAIESGDITSPFITYLYNQHRYASRDDLYGARDEGHLPDGFCSVALAWAGRNELPSARNFTPVSVTGGTRW